MKIQVKENVWSTSTTHCKSLHHTAIHCNTLQHDKDKDQEETWKHHSFVLHMLKHVAVFNNMMFSNIILHSLNDPDETFEHRDKRDNGLHTATHCNTLQHTATHCNTLKEWSRMMENTTLQNTATRCNKQQDRSIQCKRLKEWRIKMDDTTLHQAATSCDTLQHTGKLKDYNGHQNLEHHKKNAFNSEQKSRLMCE